MGKIKRRIMGIVSAAIVLTSICPVNVLAWEDVIYSDEILSGQESDSSSIIEIKEGSDANYDEVLSESKIIMSEDWEGLADSPDSVETVNDGPVGSDGSFLFEDNFIQTERNDESENVVNSKNKNALDISVIRNNNGVSKNGVKEFSDIIDYDTGSQDQIYAEGYPTGRVKSIAIDGGLDLAYSVGCKVLSGSISAFTDDDDYYGDPVDVSDPGVEVSGLEDTSSIGYKNIKIKYGGKTVAVKIYIGLDPKDTPVRFQNAGFNSIMECVNMISKLNKNNLEGVGIEVQKNLIEPSAIVIPMLTTKKTVNHQVVEIDIDEGIVLTLSTPSITSNDNLVISSGKTGGLRSENPDETIKVRYKYNTVRRFDSYTILSPLAYFDARVDSPGGISFIGASNIPLDFIFENAMTDTKIVDISKFASVNTFGNEIKIYGKLSEIGRIDGKVWLADSVSSSATIKNMGTQNSWDSESRYYDELILTGNYDANGQLKIPSVTIENIGGVEKNPWGEYVEYGGITLKIVDVYGNLITVPLGTPIINRKKQTKIIHRISELRIRIVRVLNWLPIMMERLLKREHQL